MQIFLRESFDAGFCFYPSPQTGIAGSVVSQVLDLPFFSGYVKFAMCNIPELEVSSICFIITHTGCHIR